MFLSSSFTTTNSNLTPWYDSLFLALGVGAPRQDRWRLCHNQHSVGCLSSPTHLPAHSSPTALGLLWPHPWAVSFLLPPSLFSKSFLAAHMCPLLLLDIQKQQIAVVLSFWSNERNSYNNDVHVLLSSLFSRGFGYTHLPQDPVFFWVLPLLPLLSQLNKLFSPALHLHISAASPPALSASCGCCSPRENLSHAARAARISVSLHRCLLSSYSSCVCPRLEYNTGFLISDTKAWLSGRQEGLQGHCWSTTSTGPFSVICWALCGWALFLQRYQVSFSFLLIIILFLNHRFQDGF